MAYRIINQLHKSNTFTRSNHYLTKLNCSINPRRYLSGPRVKHSSGTQGSGLVSMFNQLNYPELRSTFAPSQGTNTEIKYRRTSTLVSAIASDVKIKHPKLVGAILDWSGTLSDIYSISPAYGFYRVFKKYQVPITMEEARGPMGLSKDKHLRKLLQLPHVQPEWLEVYGHDFNEIDFARLLEEYKRTQINISYKFADIIPYADQVIYNLRNKFGLYIGLTTGFPKSVSDIFRVYAGDQGLILDACVASDEIKHSRPAPDGVLENVRRFLSKKSNDEMTVGKIDTNKLMTNSMDNKSLVINTDSKALAGLTDSNALLAYAGDSKALTSHVDGNMVADGIDGKLIVKVDDTIAGIEEGRAAGMWTVGIYGTSSYMDMDSIEQARNMIRNNNDEYHRRVNNSIKKLLSNNVNFLIFDISQLPRAVEQINVLLSSGYTPSKVNSPTVLLYNNEDIYRVNSY